MRETDNGSVPAERFGPCMARRLRALLRLQSRAAGEMLLQGSEALLQERLLQVRVCVCFINSYTWKDRLNSPTSCLSVILKKKKNGR